MLRKEQRGAVLAALVLALVLAPVLAATACASGGAGGSGGGPTPTAPTSGTAVIATAGPDQPGPDGPRPTRSGGTAASNTTAASATPTSPTHYTPPPTGGTPPAGYPRTVAEYAKAIVAAWESGDGGDVLLALMTQSGYLQLVAVPFGGRYTYLRCSGSPLSACSFTNDNGDVLTIRVTNALVGQAHAATGATLDRTAYPTTAPNYVQAFIDAWEFGNTSRLRQYASSSIVDSLGPAPVSPGVPTPACCASAGRILITVSSRSGQLTFEVMTSRLGGKLAIVGYSAA